MNISEIIIILGIIAIFINPLLFPIGVLAIFIGIALEIMSGNLHL